MERAKFRGGRVAPVGGGGVGIPDRHYGQDIRAGIVLRVGLACREDELRDFCQTALGRYKTPRVFRFVDELPRGPSGK
ncbi:MAG: AMP-binding enzyme, partial [Rudaea sp.]